MLVQGFDAFYFFDELFTLHSLTEIDSGDTPRTEEGRRMWETEKSCLKLYKLSVMRHCGIAETNIHSLFYIFCFPFLSSVGSHRFNWKEWIYIEQQMMKWREVLKIVRVLIWEYERTCYKGNKMVKSYIYKKEYNVRFRYIFKTLWINW